MLVEKLSDSLQYPEKSFGKPGLTPEKQTLIFVWYMANLDSIREIARLFGVTKSTTHKCIRRVSRAICNLKYLIKFPNIEEQQEISNFIKDSSNVEGCIGFVDGTHIRLSRIPEKDNDYINRKGFPSCQLQLIVDHKMPIRDTYVGWPGCTHDARVFRNSPIAQALLNDDGGQLLMPGGFIIGIT